jgi:hypothetical protein
MTPFFAWQLLILCLIPTWNLPLPTSHLLLSIELRLSLTVPRRLKLNCPKLRNVTPTLPTIIVFPCPCSL